MVEDPLALLAFFTNHDCCFYRPLAVHCDDSAHAVTIRSLVSASSADRSAPTTDRNTEKVRHTNLQVLPFAPSLCFDNDVNLCIIVIAGQPHLSRGLVRRTKSASQSREQR